MTGGDLASADGALQVAIPAGALPSNVIVSVTPTTSPGSGSIGTVYEIGPTGTQFTTPITLTLQYDSTKLAGTDPSMLRVATYASGSWQMLPGAKVDTQAKTVSGTTTHLSPYTLVSAATGAICASISGGSNCTGTSGPAGTFDPSTSVSCTPSTCADAANACAGYPGAKVSGCVESSTGFTATCCFDPGAPICFSSGGGAACLNSGAPSSGGASSGGSSTGTSPGTDPTGGTQTLTCPPPPTCSTATAANTCGSYPGSSVQDCTNTSSGYTAACCFAPGAPVCVSVGAGSACAQGGSVGPNGTSGTSSTTFTCPAPPTCANSNPCSNTPGTTMQSCTDSTSGYTAVCCYAPGQLPATGGGNAPSGGVHGADGGTSTGGGGGIDASTGGGNPPNPGKDGGVIIPPPSDGGSHQPPPGKDAGVIDQPPPASDGGFTLPPGKDGGVIYPPPADGGNQQPPPDKDAGVIIPPATDGGFTPPPPADAGTQPCQQMTMPPTQAGAPCGAGLSCPSTGDMYQVRCQQGGICSCQVNGQQKGMINASCSPYDWTGLMTACGFPLQ
jgi:hypothetical protein